MTHRATLTAICLVYLAATGLLLPIGSDDIRLAGVFSFDEANIDIQVFELVEEGMTARPSFKYGGGLYYPPALALAVYGWFAEPSEQLVVLFVRAFCIAAGLGCLILTYRLGRRIFGPTTGLLACFILVAGPMFLRWSVEGHPDLPQLFWTLSCLMCCSRLAEDDDIRWVLGAGLAAGLAFGTKYGGLFLLPVIGLAIFLAGRPTTPPFEIWKRLRGARAWGHLATAVAAFCVAFALSNLHAVLHPIDFLVALVETKAIVGFGHTFRVGTSGVVWFQLLGGAIGWIPLTAGAIGGLMVAVSTARKHTTSTAAIVLLAWVVLMFAYLWLEIFVRRPRYLLPLMPVWCFFAAEAYSWVAGWLTRSVGRRWVIVAGGIGIAVASIQPLWATSRIFQNKWTQVEGVKDELEAGRWLATVAPPETSVLFDAYSYVPSRFRNVYRIFGHNYLLAAHFEPDVLITRDAIAADYADTTKASLARRGREVFLDTHYFYEYLRTGLIPDYRMVRRFGGVGVYSRTRPRADTEPDAAARWFRLVGHARNSRLYRTVKAHWMMGDIHAAQDRESLAAWMYDRARGKRNFLPRLLRFAAAETLAGRADGARSALNEIAGWLEGRSAEEKRAFRNGMGKELESLGRYGDGDAPVKRVMVAAGVAGS